MEMSDAADMKSKLLSFIPCIPCRQQANNLTGLSKVHVQEAFQSGIRYTPPRPLVSTSGVNQDNLTQDEYDAERKKSAGPDDIFMLYTKTKISDDFALPDRPGLVDASCWDSSFGPFAGRAYIASRCGGSRRCDEDIDVETCTATGPRFKPSQHRRPPRICQAA